MATFHIRIGAGRPGTAVDRSRYITRQNKYSRDELDNDLLLVREGNLPKWAEDSSDFWKAADSHERKNGAAHRNLVIALPIELDYSDQKKLVREIVEMVVGPKTFEYAIHCPAAAFGKTPQPHVHVMYSDRMPDGIDRPPELHFKRYNTEKPELGGCKKDSGGKSPAQVKEDLIALRKNVSKLINTHLEKSGSEERVDHRSNQERGILSKPATRLSPAKVRLKKSLQK